MTRVRQPRARLVRARAEVVVGGGGGETRQYSDALVLYEHGKDVGGGGDDEGDDAGVGAGAGAVDGAGVPDLRRGMPIRGRTLGCFGPRSAVRLAMFRFLVYPCVAPPPLFVCDGRR